MLDKLRRYYIKIYTFFIADGYKKAKWLKKHHVFYHIGEKCSIKTNLLPAEPFLVSLHDNVWLAAGVRLITHSLACDVFNHMDSTNNYKCQYGKIEIHDNVFVGADAIIMYGTTIGKNCIVAAGAVVTKDVPSGSVVAGVPAKIISSFDEAKKKASNFSQLISESGGASTVCVRDMLKYNPVTFDIDK